MLCTLAKAAPLLVVGEVAGVVEVVERTVPLEETVLECPDSVELCAPVWVELLAVPVDVLQAETEEMRNRM
jgi:hypothetical protein